MVKYLIKFPSLEFEDIHAHDAIIQACEFFKKNTIQVQWEEIKYECRYGCESLEPLDENDMCVECSKIEKNRNHEDFKEDMD